jgi:hypothetical protein
MGDNRPANPKVNDVWVSETGVLEYYKVSDGKGEWVPYLSPPEAGPGPGFQPGFLEEAVPDEASGDDEASEDS